MDGGKEYTINELDKLADAIGIEIERTTPHYPEQDAISKQGIHTIVEKLRKTMIDIKIPAFLQPEIFQVIIIINNRTTTDVLGGQTPYKVFIDTMDPDNKHKDHTPLIEHL